MSAAKLTQWFPANVKPARPGLYELQCWVMPRVPAGYITNCAYWDGSVWRYGISRDSIKELSSSDQWRGLAKQPKGQS